MTVGSFYDGNARAVRDYKFVFAFENSAMASYVTEAGIFIGQILVGLGLGSAGISIAIGAVARAAPPEKRSLAMGLVTSFGSFGQFALVPVTQILMVAGGWQFALLMLFVLKCCALNRVISTSPSLWWVGLFTVVY